MIKFNFTLIKEIYTKMKIQFLTYHIDKLLMTGEMNTFMTS